MPTDFLYQALFNRAGILLGAVTWPHEQDIAPETLLAEMIPVDAASAQDILIG